MFDRAVQAFIEQNVGGGGQVFPGGERAGLAAIELGLHIVMHIMPGAGRAGLGIIPEHGFELAQQIGFGAEMGEMIVAGGGRLGHFGFHLGAIVTVEGIAFKVGGGDFLAAENLFKNVADGGGASTGGAGDGDDGVQDAHAIDSAPCLRKSERFLNRGEMAAAGFS